jgi:glycosyltransferase involved in cell wall biosynthesis
MKKISVIVPIYNAQTYLEKCIQSISNQTLKEIEIILVNDGSIDNSLEICRAYAKKDERIVVIDQENQGVSQARNNGMKVATGEYIGFVDPDDWIEEKMYENLYCKIKELQVPLCFCNYYKESKRRKIKKFSFEEELLSKEDIKEKLICPMIGLDAIMPKYVYVMGSVWRCLYERDFLEKNEIIFPENISLMEDLVFNVEALLKCESVGIDHTPYYHYIKNPKSILHSYNKKMWEDQVKVYERLEELLMQVKLQQEMQNRLDMRYIGMAFSAIRNEAYLSNEDQVKSRLEMIKLICSDERLKLILERVKPLPKTHKGEKERKLLQGLFLKEKNKSS